MAQWLALSPHGKKDLHLWEFAWVSFPIAKTFTSGGFESQLFPLGVNVSVTESQRAGSYLTDLFTLLKDLCMFMGVYKLGSMSLGELKKDI